MNGVVNEINSSSFEDAMDGDCYGCWYGNNYSYYVYFCPSLWTIKYSCSWKRIGFYNGPIDSVFVES